MPGGVPAVVSLSPPGFPWQLDPVVSCRRSHSLHALLQHVPQDRPTDIPFGALVAGLASGQAQAKSRLGAATVAVGQLVMVHHRARSQSLTAAALPNKGQEQRSKHCIAGLSHRCNLRACCRCTQRFAARGAAQAPMHPGWAAMAMWVLLPPQPLLRIPFPPT